MSLWNDATNFFSGGKQQGAEELLKYLQQGTDQMQGYTQQANSLLNPYRDIGLGQTNALQQAIARMTNPGQFYGDMMSNYQMSPAAQYQMKTGTQNALNAANASGMLGSSDMLRDINRSSQNIANQDMQQYFGNMMGINDRGLNLSQGLFNSGFGATGQMSNNLNSLGQAIAQMYAQMGGAANQQQQAKMGGLGNLFSAAGGLLGFL